jgi:hypothetical protein
VNLKVSGVEVTGAMHWVQSRISAQRTLSYVLYLESTNSAISGMADLRDLASDEGGVVWVRPERPESLPELLEDLAYATAYGPKTGSY